MEQIVYIHKVEVQHHNMGVVEIYIVEELVVIPMGVALLVDMAVADDPILAQILVGGAWRLPYCWPVGLVPLLLG